MSSFREIDDYLHELAQRIVQVPPVRRQRFLSEARDHLVNAARRELDRGASQETAVRRAIASFGDPEQVARGVAGEAALPPPPERLRRATTSKESAATTRARSRQLLRRFPALALLGAAAALALLLPSALVVPSSPPTSLAEYAPVPGVGEGRSDISSFASAMSGGLGFGSGSGAAAGAPAPNGPGQRKPRLKRCVGKPPRQTEDPLSPPCVPYFQGDNFGATARGVTADEIRVVLYDVRLARTDPPVDRTNSTDPNDYKSGFVRHFNDRYQTYGRTVRLFEIGGSVRPEDQRSDVQRVLELDAFAVIDVVGAESLVSQAAALGIVSLSFQTHRRADYQKVAPYLISHLPDIEDQVAIWGSQICSRVGSGPAVHSGNPGDRNRNRVFGILNGDVAPLRDMARLLRQDLRDRCDIQIHAEAGGQPGPDDLALDIAHLRGEGVTSVLYLSRISPAYYVSNASAQGWHPEWFFGTRLTSTVAYDTNAGARQYGVGWRQASGASYDVIRPARPQQEWYQALREYCPTCEEPQSPTYTHVPQYQQLRLLYWGIQSAGPRLTAHTIDRGLHAIPPRASVRPEVPAAYFAPGNYSFIKDAMEIWWDSTGDDPTGHEPGCYRLSDDGFRFRAGEWRGESRLFTSGICQATP